MAQLPRRLAELSPERRRLLERLLAGAEAARPPCADPKPAHPASAPQEVLSPHKAECRSFYDGISRRLDASDFGPFSMFLNLGYAEAATPSHSVVELPEWCLNKNSVRLVLEVIGWCDLAGRRVLDVGCGRGGGISVIKQYFAARSAVGLDLAPAAIKFCRATHRHPDVTFEVGDAERLPFPDDSFDVVINIESSSTYPDIRAFYQQVFRVLAPGGYQPGAGSRHHPERASIVRRGRGLPSGRVPGAGRSRHERLPGRSWDAVLRRDEARGVGI